MAEQGKFQWQLAGGMEHHCQHCHKPLANQRNSQRVCIGSHVVPCPKFHQNLFMPGNEDECAACKHSEAEHKKRHEKIAEAQHDLRKLLEASGQGVEPLTGREHVENKTASELGSLDESAGKMKKKDKKVLKKRQKELERKNRILSLTQEDIKRVGMIMHPHASDENGGLRDMEDPDILDNIIWCEDRAYHVLPGPENDELRDLLKKGVKPKMPDFSDDIDRLFKGLGLNKVRAKPSRDQRPLIDEITRHARKDFEEVWREGEYTAERRGGFFRYVTRGTLDRIVETKRRWMGRNLAREPLQGVQGGDEEEGQNVVVGGEDAQHDDWEVENWIAQNDDAADILEQELVAPLEDVHEEILDAVAQADQIADVEEPQAAEEPEVPQQEATETIDRPGTPAELADAPVTGNIPIVQAIVPGCCCGFCLDRSRLAINFLAPFTATAVNGQTPKDDPLPGQATKSSSLDQLEQQASLDLGFRYGKSVAGRSTPIAELPPDARVHLVAPMGDGSIYTSDLSLKAATLTLDMGCAGLLTGSVALMVDECLFDFLVHGNGDASAQVKKQIRNNRGLLAEQVWQFHLFCQLNQRNTELRNGLRAAKADHDLSQEEESELARLEGDLSASVERVCFCRGLPTERMIECAYVDCQINAYHGRCVGLHSMPSKPWYCADCIKKLRADAESIILTTENPILDLIQRLSVNEFFRAIELRSILAGGPEFLTDPTDLDWIIEMRRASKSELLGQLAAHPLSATMTELLHLLTSTPWAKRYDELFAAAPVDLSEELYERPPWTPKDLVPRLEAASQSDDDSSSEASSTASSSVSVCVRPSSPMSVSWAIDFQPEEEQRWLRREPKVSARVNIRRRAHIEAWNDGVADAL